MDGPIASEGLALFSSGSEWDRKFPDDTGFANTTWCVFERNKAEDGGAIYSAAGYDLIKDCLFDSNLAGKNLSTLPANSKQRQPSEEGGWRSRFM